MKSLKFFKPTLATTLAIGSWRLVLLLATAVSLIGYPNPASAATFNVTVGWYGGLIDFHPSSVTIHPGDQVKWIWVSSGHSTTSGSPRCPTAYGILEFVARERLSLARSTARVHFRTIALNICGLGQVIVTSATPTPSPLPGATLRNISTRAFVQTGDNVMIGGFIIEGTGPKTSDSSCHWP